MVLKPAPTRTPGRRRPWIALTIGALGAAGVVALLVFVLIRLTLPPVVPPFAAAPPAGTPLHPAPGPAHPPRAIPIVTATEAQIVRHEASRLTVFRLAENARVLILDYPTLRAQGLALNRIAAFIEKVGLPRERVLDDTELATEIARTGETTASYYYGHDYAIRDLVRFFAAADRDGVRLGEQEESIRDLLRQERLADPADGGAVLTVAQVGPDGVDAFTRRIILRHELSHGEFFTNPVYAAFVRHAWNDILAEQERAAFLAFLGAQNYDTTNFDLIVNEMQAFLMFTPDERYASAERLGLTPEALQALRERFLARMPQGWLRTLATTPLTAPSP